MWDKCCIFSVNAFSKWILKTVTRPIVKNKGEEGEILG